MGLVPRVAVQPQEREVAHPRPLHPPPQERQLVPGRAVEAGEPRLLEHGVVVRGQLAAELQHLGPLRLRLAAGRVLILVRVRVRATAGQRPPVAAVEGQCGVPRVSVGQLAQFLLQLGYLRLQVQEVFHVEVPEPAQDGELVMT